MKLRVVSGVERFGKEWQVRQGRRTDRAGMVQRAKTEPHWWQRHAGLLISGCAVLVVIGYFSWQLIHFFQAPPLEVTNPSDDISITEPVVIIQGKSVAEAFVSVNNEQVEVQSDGTFSDAVTLQPGLNVLKITSQRKRSQTASIVRRIVLETPAGTTVNTNTSVNSNTSINTNTTKNSNLNK